VANSALTGVGRRAQADGSALGDTNRFEIGQLIGATWVYCVKTGTQIKSWLKSYFDTLYCALSNFTNVLNVGSNYLHGIHSGLTETSLTWSDAEHTLTLTDAHVYYFQGVAKSQSAGVSCDLDSFTLSTGLWYISYDDASGTLVASKSPWSLLTQVPVATVFWNGSTGRVQFEGHGSRRNLEWHRLHHTYEGTEISPADFVITTPSIGSPSTINISGGTVADEDLRFTINTITSAVIWYQNGASSYTFTTGSAVYGASVRFVDSSNSYALTAVDASKYGNVWGYASTDTGDVIYTVLGTVFGGSGYNTVAAARAVTPPNLSQFGLTNELRLLYRWIYKGDGTLMETTDYRASPVLAGAGGSVAPTAAGTSFAASGNIVATNVQAAVEELDTEKYRTQTPAAASNISGSVALAFASSLTLQHTLTGNVTAFTEPTGLADGETGEALLTLAGFTLPANPAAGQRWNSDAWTVTGTYVRIVVERVGSYYYWTAESLEVAT
jgi:hypothetical protein